MLPRFRDCVTELHAENVLTVGDMCQLGNRPLEIGYDDDGACLSSQPRWIQIGSCYNAHIYYVGGYNDDLYRTLYAGIIGEPLTVAERSRMEEVVRLAPPTDFYEAPDVKTPVPTEEPVPTPAPMPGSGECGTQPWGPCGGSSDPNAQHCCPAGFTCYAQNEWFWQCRSDGCQPGWDCDAGEVSTADARRRLQQEVEDRHLPAPEGLQEAIENHMRAHM